MPGLTWLKILAIAAYLLPTVLASACHAEPANNVASGSGNDYLALVLDGLERRGNITARLRCQSHVGEETQMGSGNYWQQGVGPQRVSRWEMQTQVAGETAGYLQVFDGRYVWTDRHVPSGRKISRLDVNHLKSRLAVGISTKSAETPWAELLRSTEFRGGLSQLLAELLRQFDFAPPEATQLNGFPVAALRGRWRDEQLAELSPQAQSADAGTWPAQLPHHVLLLVGQSNLFPYVFEFRRPEDATLAEELIGLRPARDPLLRYEIFEVRFADAIDPMVFQFKAGDVNTTDETALVLERLTRQQATAAALAEESASARR